MRSINSPLQIGQILVSRRKALGVTQATIAAKLGISQQRLSDLETRSGSLTVGRLVVWLNVLNLDLAVGEQIPKNKLSAKKVEW